MLRQRMDNYCSSIRTKSDTPFARHIKTHGHILAMNVTVLQLIWISDQEDEQITSNRCENNWIVRLYTLVPKEMNILD